MNGIPIRPPHLTPPAPSNDVKGHSRTLGHGRYLSHASWQVDLVVGEADFVVARWTATGTFTGEWGGTAPTRKSATFSGVNIFRFGNDGKVTELWNHRDDLGLMEQLGAAVYAGAASAAVTASPEPSGLKGHS